MGCFRTFAPWADEMNRVAASLLSVVVAYGLCAASGVNKWMYVWLKAFYPSYVVVLWVLLAVLFSLYGARTQARNRSWVLVGPAVGYLAGLIAYQLAPAIRDGSFARGTATIAAQGLLPYAETSALHPLLCLSPIVGLVAAAVLVALTQPAARYVAASVVAIVFVIGWSFFLSHGALPTQW
jgi:hypothetical protein